MEDDYYIDCSGPKIGPPYSENWCRAKKLFDLRWLLRMSLSEMADALCIIQEGAVTYLRRMERNVEVVPDKIFDNARAVAFISELDFDTIDCEISRPGSRHLNHENHSS